MYGIRRLNEFVALGSANWFWTKTPAFLFHAADEATAFVREKIPNNWNVQVVSTTWSEMAFGA